MWSYFVRIARIVQPSIVHLPNSLKPMVLRYSSGTTTAGNIYINLVYNQEKVDLCPSKLLDYFFQNIDSSAEWHLCVSSSDFWQYKGPPSGATGQMVVFDMFYTKDLNKDAGTVAKDIGDHLRSVLGKASSTKIFLRKLQSVVPYEEF